MSTKNAGGQAFPQPQQYSPNGDTIAWSESGMTLRQWYAGLAMQGLLANSVYVTAIAKAKANRGLDASAINKDIVLDSVQFADDLIAEEAK